MREKLQIETKAIDHCRPSRIALFLILSLFFMQPSSEIQAQILNIQTYSVKDGLAQSQVQSIIQDSQGYLWFGTVDGLSRFNGTSFVNFTVKDGMASNEVTACAQIGDGTIWFGHSDGKITIYSPVSQRFSKFQTDKRLGNSQITFIFEDTGHQIWIGTYDNGLYKYSRGDGLVHFTMKNGLPYDGIFSICQLDSNTLCLGTENGLVQIPDRVDSNKINAKILFPSNKNLLDNIESLLLDSRGHLWIGTIRNGLYEYFHLPGNKNRWTFHQYSIHNRLPSNWVESLFEDRDQNILIGTFSGGIVKLTPDRRARSGRYRFFYIDKNHGLPNNCVNIIYQDSEGNYWFGTDGGGTAQFRDSSFMLFTKKDGLPGNSIWSIKQSKNGRFWIGTENGLATCAIKSKSSRSLSFKFFTKKDGLSGNYIHKIFVDSTDMLWLITADNGVTQFDPTTYQTKKFMEANGFPSNEVNCIQSDKNGNLWFGTYSEGAFIYDVKRKKYKFFTKEDGLGGDQINQILRDRSGTLWFATNGGLTRYNGISFRNFGTQDGLSQSDIISIAEDSSRHIWVGSSGGGVFIFDGIRFKNYNTRNGLSGDFIYSITGDGKKFMWIGTSKGVDRFDLRDSTLTHFGRRQGFLGIECNQGASYRDKYGTLWFGTIRGLVHFNPKMAKPNTHPPGIKITGVQLFYRNIPFTRNLKLNHHQNHLTFHFEAISFTQPSLIRYRFRLDGFTKDWSPLTKQTEAIYPKLPPGHYVFQVQARNGDGIWSTQTAKLPFRITPPFWLTGWFVFLILSVGIASVFLVHRIRENRIRATREMLERKVRARTQELNREKERLQLTLQALAKSEEKFRAVTSVVDAFLWSADVDAEGGINYTLYTENVSKLTGIAADEFLKPNSNLWLNSIHPEDKKFVKNALKKLLSGESASGAYRIRRRDGEIRWVYDSAMPKKDKTGRVVELNGVCVDITDLKQAEAALAESEEKFRMLAESTPSAVFVYREKFLYVNPTMERITGYTVEELLSKNFWDIIHPDFREEIKRQEIARLSGKYMGTRYESKILTKSGEERWIDFDGRPIVFKGEKAGIGSAIDITDRKKMEEALLEEKEQLAVTLQSITDAVISTTVDGKILLMNRTAEKLTGWDYPSGQSRLFSEIFRIRDENTGKPCEDPIQQVVATQDLVELPEPCVLFAKDGTQHLIAASAAPITHKNKTIGGVIVAFRDVTEKRKMEQELLKADKLESLGLLAGGIAHDFNNILMGIMGNISLAKTEIEHHGDLFDILTEAEKAASRAKDLTQQLLTFSKGGSPIRKAVFIEKLVKETCRFALRGSNISFEFSSANDLWPANADEGQISQVMNNLIINAKHSMPTGGRIRVRVENARAEEIINRPLSPGRYVKITVEDEGTGIPKEHLSKIFDPYFTTKQQGSGLGLSSVYSIIKRHKGHIEVESKLGKGTRFTFFLPASEGLPEKKLPKAEGVESHKGRILLMDDEEIIRKVVSRMLKSLGLTATVTAKGEEAVEIYREAFSNGNPFDLVILDLTVPGGMGGKETLQELRKIDPKVKAIVSSGYSTDAVMSEYHSFGFAGIITKPFHLNELAKTVREVLNNGKKL